MSTTSTPYKAKVVMVGNSGVGKTSIVVRMNGEGFDKKVSASLGASYIVIKGKHRQYDVNLLVWDTAGQERFRSMVPLYARGARAAILVYDITNRRSFEELTDWWKEIMNASEYVVSAIVVANKTDMEAARKVTREEGERFAIELGAIYCETSAKDGVGIGQAMQNAMDTVGAAMVREKSGSLRSIIEFGSSKGAAVKKRCC
uniref:Small GTP-binding protein n=1 Tax=Panagrellus redivivus TaxID=6233 RepID=A0A7E4V7Q8_PANRE